MEAFSGSAVAGKLAVEGVKFGVRRGWFRRFTDTFREKHRVFVLGSTGAGKTNFLLSLRKEAPAAIPHGDRTEFVTSHTLDIGGNLFAFVDMPGQPGQESRRGQAIRTMPRLKTTGVINVVSYGYHEYRRGSAGHRRCRGQHRQRLP
ncbi:MAG TPA: GTPase domain-containing protein [Longimicrobium sp.]|nr:GTPase domain-containing protein [Longimicrobium sp.]